MYLVLLNPTSLSLKGVYEMEKPGTHVLQVLLLTALRNAPAWEEQQWISPVSQALKVWFCLSDPVRKICFSQEVIAKQCSNLWIRKKKIPANVNFPPFSVENLAAAVHFSWNSIISLSTATDVSAGIKALFCRTYKCEETSSGVRAENP